MGLLTGLGRTVEKVGSNKGLMLGVGALAFGTGMLNKAAPAARDAAMETAFDDPNADIAFMGKKFSGSFILGQAIGGTAGTMSKIVNPLDAAYTGGAVPGPAATGGVGAVVGGGIGAAAGVGLGGLAGGAIGGRVLKATGKIAGGALGMAAGAAIGGALGAFGPAAGYMNRDRRFFQESPYAPSGNASSQIASSLNASGDIVLGMHNSRRGY